MKVLKSSTFDKWLHKLNNPIVKVSILRRLEQIETKDHLGDYKFVDTDLYELRFFNRGGLRIFFTFDGDEIIILLNAGDKDSQSDDIKKAKEILTTLAKFDGVTLNLSDEVKYQSRFSEYEADVEAIRRGELETYPLEGIRDEIAKW